MDAEVYHDNLEVSFAAPRHPATARARHLTLHRTRLQHQAAHLNRLAATRTLFPVDLRRSPSSSSHSHHAHTCSDPTHHHPPAPVPILDPEQDRRKLVRAIAARKDGATRKGTANAVKVSRFMQGPEPSWVRTRS